MPRGPGRGLRKPKSAPRTGSLVSEVYEAALKPSHWAAVLARLVTEFKGSGAALRTFEATPEKGGFWCTYGIEPPGLEEFEQYFSTRNIWQARAEALGFYKTGTVMTSDTLLHQRELRASEFHRGFLRHYDIQDLLALVLHDGLTPPMPRTVVSIFRSHRQARFGKADIEAAREYVPHLARAVE